MTDTTRSYIFGLIVGAIVGVFLFVLGMFIRERKDRPQPSSTENTSHAQEAQGNIVFRPTDSPHKTVNKVIRVGSLAAQVEYQDHGSNGDIHIQCNRPVFGLKENTALIKTDNVIVVCGIGYGICGNRYIPVYFKGEDTGKYDPYKRQCFIKWQTNRDSLTVTIRRIIENWKP